MTRERTQAQRDYEELTVQPENMGVGQLNHVVRALRERLYQATLERAPALLEAIQTDVGLLLEALGKPNVARPISAHEVMLECIETVKNLRAPAIASMPTDHPSNPPSQTKGEEIGHKVAKMTHRHPEECRTRNGAPCPLARHTAELVDSALAAQEARHKAAMEARDDVWIDRANRYFVGVREPRKMLAAWAPGTEVADVVMHEVWKRDPNVQLAVEQERTRIVNLLCDRCRAGEPVVERRLPNMGLGHTLPGIPHPGWARCYAEEIHADLRSRSTTSNPCERCGTPRTKAEGGETFTVCDDCWARMGEEHARAHGVAPSESPSLTRLKAAAADLVKPKGERTFFTLHAPAAGGGVRVLQGRILPAGSDEGYFKTGHRKALMVLPSQASDYLLTREWVNQLFDEAESAAAKDAGR